MIFAHLDNSSPRKILGYEVGTRAVYDVRHGTDPNWSFIDSDVMNHRVDLPTFLKDPTKFILDDTNTPVKVSG